MSVLLYYSKPHHLNLRKMRNVSKELSVALRFSLISLGFAFNALSRSHLNGYGKTCSHHFLMDYTFTTDSFRPDWWTWLTFLISFFFYYINLFCVKKTHNYVYYIYSKIGTFRFLIFKKYERKNIRKVILI